MGKLHLEHKKKIIIENFGRFNMGFLVGAIFSPYAIPIVCVGAFSKAIATIYYCGELGRRGQNNYQNRSDHDL
ncbi:MAG: hypothetical protein U9Q06_01810 [Nanoarchaeota archaeon]|nr:hypothetical protein [Nanoarchaeota archaeon]